MSVERQPLGSRWTARIKRLKLSSNSRAPFTHDTFFVGSFRSKELALKAAKRAMKKREAGNIPLLPPPSPLLCATQAELDLRFLVSHLVVSIESDRFEKFGSEERRKVAWEAIMRCKMLRPFFIKNNLGCFQKVACLSTNFCALPCFSFLGLNISLECTAKQPDSIAPLIAIRGAPRKLIAKLRAVQKKTDSIVYKEMKPGELRHLLDKRTEPSGAGPFSHVYHSLAERLNLAEERPTSRTDESASPEQLLELAKEKYLIAALTLQRTFRRRFQGKLRRWWFKQELGALNIQRWYRGVVSRVRTRIWADEIRAAAKAIQATRRMVNQLRKTRKIRQGVKQLQAMVRGRIQRRLMDMARRYHRAIVTAQKVMRGHLGRLKFAREKELDYYIKVQLPAATNMQRLVRGHLGRRHVERVKATKYHNEVYVPSITLVQSLARRKAAARELAKRKEMYSASVAIQRICRGRIQRKLCAKLSRQRELERAATCMSKIIRGHQCRILYAYLGRKHFFDTRVLAAVRTIQARWKGKQTRAAFRLLVYQDTAVCVLQSAWRGYVAKRNCREKPRRDAKAL